MLPYYEQPTFPLGPIDLYPFGVLVALAVIVGIELADWRARKTGLDTAAMSSFAIWVVGAGMIGAHLLDALWYHPAEVIAAPSSLLTITSGLSSFGGFVGALVGALAWRARTRLPVLPYIDATLSIFPLAWAIGRLGCTVAHDHPGARTSPANAIAFAYPDGPRWDLGFAEMLFALALAAVCARLWRRPRPTGTYVVWTALTYAPVRFALDFLRMPAELDGDARYGGLTPAQWGCIVLACIGMGMGWHMRDELGRARRAPRTHDAATRSRPLPPGSRSPT